VAEILAQRLGIPHAMLDRVTWNYAEEYGYGSDAFDQVMKTQGFLEADRRLQPALAYALERFVADYRDCVLDMGAGHCHFAEDDLFTRVRQVLVPFDTIVLLLPSPDLDASICILKERNRRERNGDWLVEGKDYFEAWVKDPCFSLLATRTVYTEGTSPEETAEDILRDYRLPTG
jgi:hypothetical protein